MNIVFSVKLVTWSRRTRTTHTHTHTLSPSSQRETDKDINKAKKMIFEMRTYKVESRYGIVCVLNETAH